MWDSTGIYGLISRVISVVAILYNALYSPKAGTFADVRVFCQPKLPLSSPLNQSPHQARSCAWTARSLWTHFLPSRARLVRLGNDVCHVGPCLAAMRKRHRRYTRCKECGAVMRGWLLLRWSFACTWRPNECQRAPLCRNNRRHPMQCQAGASPWDRHVAVGNPVAGQWTRDDSPALELWLGPWGPERWGDWVYRGHPNMSHAVYQNWRRHRPDGIDSK